MKRAIKFLLFVVALFVTVNVKALEDISVESLGLNIDTDLRDVSRKHVIGTDYYAFCLDRARAFIDNLNYKSTGVFPISDIDNSDVRNVLLKAYSEGLGTGSNVYGLSEDEFYAVTQLAVWHAAHGESENGYDENLYGSWLGNGERRNAFNYLITAESDNSLAAEQRISLSNNIDMKLTEDGQYYVSNGISFDAPKNAKYTLVISEGIIVYNGKEYTEEVEIEPGKEFMLKVKNDGSKELTVSATIKSTNVLVGYDFSMFTAIDKNGKPFIKSNGEPNNDEVLYYYNGKPIADDDGTPINGGVQRLGVLVPSYGVLEQKITAKVVTNAPTKHETKEVEIKICTSNECEIESDITVRELVKDNDFGFIYFDIDSWNAKSGDVHKINVKVDTFYRLEDSLSDEAIAIYFKVTESGEVKLCNIKNKDLDTAECDNIESDYFEIVNNNEIVINNCVDKEKEGTGIVKTDDNSNDTIVQDIETSNIEVPNTGITTSAYIIGGLVMLVGAGTVVIAKKKENM